ncbi:acetyl-coenzyme A transporter 1 [Babesia caballi]|uniref:Acetyl-coenzyme A transporter 1 n=1 Tax=Babesia caballi TaxID=5871 RepID=A0AAV4M3W5_BABCB|nr:acetyl-coenzyme A transporter 1 [Babesia caballi]
MLRRDMREHASTCNAVGQSIGMNIAYVGFTTLSTVKVSVKLYRAWIWLSACFGVHRPALSHEEEATFQPYATISDFTWFFGLFTLLVTFVVMFKREGNEGDEPTLKELPGVTELRIRDDPNRRKLAEIRRSYAQLLEVVKIKPVRLLGVALLTCNFFYAAENPAELKLLEKGVPMDIFAMITPIMIPLQIIGPPFITMAIRNSSTAEVIYKGLKVHLVAMALCIVLVYVAGMFYAQQSYHWFESALFYAIFFGISLFRKICALVVSVAFIALFAKVADPSVGGTYMTLLNTLANVGELIPQMVGLWLIDILGSGECIEQCLYTFAAKPGGTDGLYVEALLCVIAGVVFLPRYKYMLKRVESFQVDEWYVNKFSSE